MAPTRSTVRLVTPPVIDVELFDDTQPMRLEPQPGDVIADRYELLERLAAGGLGVVFRAMHRETGRVVAVKLLHDRYRDEPSLIERTAREARYACAIHHPSIVEVLDAGRSADGQAYITMEFLDGRTLRAVLKDAGCVAPIDVAEILLPIVEAVAAAHATGVVHRDLKPENVIVLESGGVRTIKVLDFGVAGSVSEPGVDHRLTTVGTVLGTHAYMSPEQATAGEPVPSFDVYALGVMAYEMLTGVLPFGSNPARSLTAKIRGIVDAGPYDRAEVPEAWRVLVARCVAIDPGDRPSTAELRVELLRLAGRQRVSIAERVGAAVRRARIGIAIACAGAVVGAGTWFALARAPEEIATAPVVMVLRADQVDPKTLPPRPPPPTVEHTIDEPMHVAPTSATRPMAPLTKSTAVPPSPGTRTSKRAPAERKPVANEAAAAPEAELACGEVHASMQRAREGHRWGDMLAAADVRRCWSGAERKQWRTKALMELGRFAACAAEGKDAASDQVRGWAELCARRVEKSAG